MDFERLQDRYRGSRARDYNRRRERTALYDREQATIDAFLAQVPQGSSLVDVPVGTGRYLELYKKHNLAVTGLDVSDDMLAEARAEADALSLAATLRREDVRHISVPDGGFDTVLCMRFLNWLDTAGLETVMTELVRVARSHLILGVHSKLTNPKIKSRSLWRTLKAYKKTLSQRIRGTERSAHDQTMTLALFARRGLSIVEVRSIDPKDDGTDYLVYLLRRGP
jgi:ubiquinone/menaquinone biosynthesis C-methylase UbiE